MGFAQAILDRRRRPPQGLEQRVAEWGSSALPSPLATGAGGSYATVNLAKLESNLQQVAVWSAIDLIASVASQLPLDTFKAQSDGGPRNLANPRVVMDPAGDDQGAADWIYQYLVSKLGRGNVFGRQILDSSTGFPTQTVLYHPDEVRAERDRTSGKARFWVDGKAADFPVWHKRSYPVPGMLLGLSPMTVHMTTIGLGVSSTRFGAQFFTDSAVPSALLQNSEIEIDQTIAAEVKARWMAAIWGTREPAVFGKGWDYKPISLAPEESQFLETNKYSQAQCARIYGPTVAEILGYETGGKGSMTYANVEQRSIDFLKFTLNRWLRDLEAVMTAWIPRGQYVKFNRNALLETDLKTRFEAYQLAIGSKFMAPSEARELEDWAPLTDVQREEIAATSPQPAPAVGGDGAAGQRMADPAVTREQLWDQLLDSILAEPLALEGRPKDWR